MINQAKCICSFLGSGPAIFPASEISSHACIVLLLKQIIRAISTSHLKTPFAINSSALSLPAFSLVALLLFELSFCWEASYAIRVMFALSLPAFSLIALLLFELSFC